MPGTFRETSNWVSVYRGYRHTSNCGSSWTLVDPPSQVVLKSVDYKKTWGWETPNFHDLRRKGQLLPFTPFTQIEASGSVEGDRHNVQKSNPCVIDEYQFYAPYGEWVIPESELLALGQDLLNEHSAFLVQQAASKIYQKSFDGLTFIAELHKSVALFKDIVGRLISLAKSGNLSRAWLEGRYGWRLLVFDIEDLNSLIRNLDSEEFNRERFKSETTYSWLTQDSIDDSNVYENRLFTYSTSYEVSLRGSVVADYRPPPVTFNPIVTAWELVPLSFVLDWVWGVGRFLNAMSLVTLAGSYVAGSGILVKAKRESSLQFSTKPASYYNSTTFQNGSFEAQLVIRRPQQVQSSPLFHLNIDLLKGFDLFALISQITKR